MKDFEDTDREGATMDSRKPLTAGEIDELQRLHLVVTQDMRNFPERTPDCYKHFCSMMFDALPRLLSLLTPPPDAAVREAVERLSAGVNGPWEGSGSMFADIRTLLRAVQAPRLTEEQVEAAFREGYELGNDDGRNIDVFCHIKQHNPESNPDFAWEHSNTRRAAFPGAGGGVKR